MDWDDLADRRMDRLAYAARYGHQPLDLLLHVDTGWLNRFVAALSKLVRRENKAESGE